MGDKPRPREEREGDIAHDVQLGRGSRLKRAFEPRSESSVLSRRVFSDATSIGYTSSPSTVIAWSAEMDLKTLWMAAPFLSALQV